MFIERLWRSVKYEYVYLRAYDSVSEARASIGRHLSCYNGRRPHSSLYSAKLDEAYFRNQLLPARSAGYPGRDSTYQSGNSVQIRGTRSAIPRFPPVRRSNFRKCKASFRLFRIGNFLRNPSGASGGFGPARASTFVGPIAAVYLKFTSITLIAALARMLPRH